MIIPIFGSILTVEMRGARSASCVRVSGSASAILSRMNSRARFACSSAFLMISA